MTPADIHLFGHETVPEALQDWLTLAAGHGRENGLHRFAVIGQAVGHRPVAASAFASEACLPAGGGLSLHQGLGAGMLEAKSPAPAAALDSASAVAAEHEEHLDAHAAGVLEHPAVGQTVWNGHAALQSDEERLSAALQLEGKGPCAAHQADRRVSSSVALPPDRVSAQLSLCKFPAYLPTGLCWTAQSQNPCWRYQSAPLCLLAAASLHRNQLERLIADHRMPQ